MTRRKPMSTMSTREEVVSRLGSGFERVTEEIDKLAASLEKTGADTAERYRPALDRLRRTRDAAVASLPRLEREAEASWDELRVDAERAYHQLEAEIDRLRTDLLAELADAWDDYRAVADEQLQSWRRRIDQLRVQASLAGMEARQEIHGLVARMESACQKAEQLRNAERTTGEEPVLHRAISDLVWEMRSTVDEARRLLTRTGSPSAE